MRNANVAIGCAGAHFGTVRWKPRDFEPRVEARFGKNFAGEQDALAAKSGNADAQFRP